MAIIGFIVILLIGAFIIFRTLALVYVTIGFAGRLQMGDLPYVLVRLAIGVALIYAAVHFAPFHIVFTKS